MDQSFGPARPRARIPRGALVSAVILAVLGPGLAVAGGVAGAAPVSWPPSTGLVLSEIVTGGASASDEFIELYNAGAAPSDLAGLEVGYISSSGTTVTRKVAWSTSLIVDPGRHVLLANASGIYAASADATYSGGLAATGGAVVLQATGGAPIDAVGWGTATNAYVEGAAAQAPDPGTSIERLPGGFDGNGQDTNENAADFVLRAAPTPQRLTDPPVPVPGPSPTPTTEPTPEPTVEPTPTPEPTAPPTPTPEPTARPTPTPTATPEPTAPPTPTPEPTARPTPTPTATPEPTVHPTPTPTATPTQSPSPSPSVPPSISIAQARGLADGSTVTVTGTLTTPPGFIESAREAFFQDATAGIALHLTVPWPAFARGDGVRATGTLDTRYGQRIIRIDAGDDLQAAPAPVLGSVPLIPTGSAGEAWEGFQVRVQGVIGGARSDLADGFAVDVDDGSGLVRVVAVVASGVTSADLAAGTRIAVTGVLGQHDSAGGGTSGYRLYVRDRDDLVPMVDPSPSPSPSPTPTLTPTASPTPTATPSPSPTAKPSPTPSPSPAPVSIASARGQPLGTRVTVEGTVTAETGAVVDARTAAVQDASGGILVRLPVRGAPALARGDRVAVSGVLAARYGALELRVPSADAMAIRGTDPVPSAREVAGSDLGEALEGALVVAHGTVSRTSRGSSGSLTATLAGTSGSFVVSCWRGCGAALVRGAPATVTGIAGQRASRAGAADGYRIWPRDAADIVPADASDQDPGGTATPGPTAGASPVPVGDARQRAGETVTIDAWVTTAPGFIDSDPRRIVVQDDSAGILVRLPVSRATARVGDRLRITGRIGTYRDAPQLAATSASGLPPAAMPAPLRLTRAPAEEDEWRLVSASGTVASVRRYGSTWRAELRADGGALLVVQGTSRSGIPSTALTEGRAATVTGIVRRPAAGSTDTRWAVLPRTQADIVPGPAVTTMAISAGGSARSVGRVGRDEAAEGVSGAPAPGADGTTALGPAIDVDLADLDGHPGERVRVGGLVVEVTSDGVTLDDGTAVGRVRLEGDAVGVLTLIAAGEPLNVTGIVHRASSTASEVIATGASAVARVGSLGEVDPIVAAAPVGTGPSPSADESGGDSPLREQAMFHLGPLAIPAPGGIAPWFLGLAVLAALAVAAGWSARRLDLRRREEKGARMVDRLATILAPAGRSR